MSTHDSLLDIKAHIANTTDAQDESAGDRTINVNDEQMLSRPKRAPSKQDPDPFIWLAPWLVYFPSVVKYKVNNGKVTKCNPICSTLVYIYVVIASIALLLWYCIPPFIEDGFTLFAVVYVIAMLLQTISKLVSVHYFWTYFNFDTLRSVSLVNINNNVHFDTSSIIKEVNLRFKIILGIFILFTIVLIVVKIIRISLDEESVTMDWIECGRTIIYYYTFDIPYLLTQFVLSIYYCKAHIFIQDLNKRIKDSDEIDFGTICDEYKAFRGDFQTQIWYLEFTLKYRLAALVAWIWIDITEIARSEDGWYGIRNFMYLALGCIPPIELVLAGSPASTTYHSFKKRVHDIKQMSLQLLYFLTHIAEYPFLVKIFAREISIRNALKVAAAFAAAKVLSYLFRQHEL